MLNSSRCVAHLLVLLLFMSVMFVFSSSSFGSDVHVCQSKFSQWMDDWLSRNEGRATFGVSVRCLNSESSFNYQYNAKKLFQPASTNKVLTTVAALVNLGSAYQFRTRILIDKNTKRRLRIEMTGDPSLSSTVLVDKIKSLSIEGSIETVEVDISAFKNTAPLPDSWEFGDLGYDYGAQPSCSVLDHNFVIFRISPGASVGQPLSVVQLNDQGTPTIWENVSVFGLKDTRTVDNQETNIREPDLFYRPGEDALRIVGQMKLGAKSVDIVRSVMKPDEYIAKTVAKMVGARNSTVTSEPPSENYVSIGTILSEPITVLMNKTLLESDNLYAELFMRQLGVLKSKSASDDIEQIGIERVRSVLVDALGVSADSFRQADGSGLSRQNLVSPQSLVETFYHLYQRDRSLFKLYKSMLPVGGVSGTLKNRFVDYPGVVQAKTGSMTGVISLSGLVDSFMPNHDPYLFAFIVNQSSLSSSQIRKAMDEVVIALHQTDRSC